MAEVKTVKINIETNAKKVATDMKSINDATKQATDSVEGLGDASEEASGKTKVFSDIVNVVRGMVPGFKAAEGGVTSFGTSLKALIANPVVLTLTVIIGALKFIYEAFQSNVKIGKEIAAVWEGLSAVGKQITDAVFGLVRSFAYAAEAAYKFITLDFAGASEAMKKANGEAAGSFDQLTNAVNGTTFSIVRGLEKQQQANNKAKKEQAVRESEINKLLVQSREILTDETASIKEKKKALEEVTKAEKASAAEKVRTAKIDLEILEKKAKALGGQAEKKMKQEIRDATIALNEAEMENAQTGIKLNKQRKMLARQEAEDAKAAAAEAKERHKEYLEQQKEKAKAREDALAKIKEAEKEYTDTFLGDQQKEINAVETKYSELIALAKKHKQDTTTLEEARKNALNEINLKYIKIEEETNEKLLQQKREQYKKEEDLRRQQIAEEEAYFEQYTNATLTAQQLEVQAVTDKYFILIEQAKKYGLDTVILEEKQRKEIAAINKKYDEEEQARRQKRTDNVVQNVTQAMSVVSEFASQTQRKYDNLNKAILDNDKLTDKEKQRLLDENNKRAKKAFEVQKAVSIASALIATYQSAVSAYQSQFLPLPDPSSPIRGAIAAAIAVAAGLANVKNITAQKFEGASVPSSSSSGGGSASAGGSGVMSPNFNIVGNAQATNPLAGLGNQPIQAYVVSGEVTTAQSLDRNRINYATFG